MMKKCNFDQDEQITIEDEEEAELIEKNSLLLRKVEFQELFNGYYYSRQDVIPEERHELKERDRKSSNNPKRIISAYRKSSHQEKEVRLIDLVPEKKLSYNEAYNRKKLELQLKPDKYHRHIDNPAEHGLREKKRSGQFEKTFFR